jgi:hypothetical protein
VVIGYPKLNFRKPFNAEDHRTESEQKKASRIPAANRHFGARCQGVRLTAGGMTGSRVQPLVQSEIARFRVRLFHSRGRNDGRLKRPQIETALLPAPLLVH